MKLKTTLSTLALAAVVLLAGCSKDDNNDTSLSSSLLPTIALTNPANNATDVALNTTVNATFSKEMSPTTINASTFTLMQGEKAVVGTVSFSYTSKIATFTPAQSLAQNTPYTATITTGARDIIGGRLAENYTFGFTTIKIIDTALPLIVSTFPINNQMNVAQNKLIAVDFSESMDVSTINNSTFTLKQGTTTVEGTIAYLGTTATFTPKNTLLAGTQYTATVTTGVKDLAGNALAATKEWSFTTEGAPAVLSVSPLNGDINVMSNVLISASFDKAMNASTIDASTFTLKQGVNTIEGAVTYSGTTAKFTPKNTLLAGTQYTATVTTGVKDLTGNALATNKVWSFTTEAAPAVLSVSPLNGANNVMRNALISASFDKAMNASTIDASTFTLKQGGSTVEGTVTYSGTTAKFTPKNTLLAGTQYTATVTTGVKDLAGNALATNKVWSFTTVAASANQAVVNLKSAINYVILAKTKISTVPTSKITGDMGLSPAATSYITGFSLTDWTGYATSPQVTGKVYAADMVTPTSGNLTTAVEDMMLAYTDAAGRPTPDFLNLGTGNIGGKTLAPGLYKWTSTVTLPTNVTISGGANDIWIFQISGDLDMSAGVNVTLAGGAQAKNIFWQVAGEATFGATSHFEGIILSMTGITFKTGASFKGRALAQTAVILDANIIVNP